MCTTGKRLVRVDSEVSALHVQMPVVYDMEDLVQYSIDLRFLSGAIANREHCVAEVLEVLFDTVVDRGVHIPRVREPHAHCTQRGIAPAVRCIMFQLMLHAFDDSLIC